MAIIPETIPHGHHVEPDTKTCYLSKQLMKHLSVSAMENPFYNDWGIHTKSKSKKSKPAELILKDHPDLVLSKHNLEDPNL